MNQPKNRSSTDAPRYDDQSLGAGLRTLISVAILAWLLLVLLGPLSNPIASEHLTGPLAKLLRPVHQATFTGHGYRFFGPDPGPSHITSFEIETEDGQQISGKFPDPNEYWPRLRYHRWFMLSESLFQQVSMPPPEEHRQTVAAMQRTIEQLRLEQKLPAMRKLVAEKQQLVQEYELARKRSDDLLRGLAEYLLSRHDGQKVELQMRERLIAPPFDVASGIQLNDSRFLSEPRKLGEFTRDDLRSGKK